MRPISGLEGTRLRRRCAAHRHPSSFLRHRPGVSPLSSLPMDGLEVLAELASQSLPAPPVSTNAIIDPSHQLHSDDMGFPHPYPADSYGDLEVSVQARQSSLWQRATRPAECLSMTTTTKPYSLRLNLKSLNHVLPWIHTMTRAPRATRQNLNKCTTTHHNRTQNPNQRLQLTETDASSERRKPSVVRASRESAQLKARTQCSSV